MQIVIVVIEISYDKSKDFTHEVKRMKMIFASFILISVLSAISSGQTAQLSASIAEGASAGVTLALSLAGPVCLWCGLAHAMEQCGWMDGLARLFAPILKQLFP